MTNTALWDTFSGAAYHREHFAALWDGDVPVLQIMADHFAAADIPLAAYGLDVGTGPNLYPALAMLPWCARVELWEPGADNRGWLRDDLARVGEPWSWTPHWSVLEAAQPRVYKPLQPRAALLDRVHIVPAGIWDLPERAFDLATMTTVAESITSDYDTFVEGARRFVRCLKPGAPFAATFSVGSTGYTVAGTRWPAVTVGADDIAAALEPVSQDVRLHPIPTEAPWREGVALLLATGRAR